MILITGATGLVGGHLLYRFRESGKNIVATYRTLQSLDKTREIFESYQKGAGALVEQFNWMPGDVMNLPSLENAMRGVKTVYHCAAAIENLHFEEMKNINMRGAENVINVAIASGVEKICHVSSIAALGEALGERPVNEEDYFNLDGLNTDYAITKFGGEMEAWRASQENIKVIIVNPGVVIGEGNWQSGSGKLISKTAQGNSFYTSGGSGFVDVRDLTLAMKNLTESAIDNERFIVVAENRSYRNLLNLIATSLNQQPPSIHLPFLLLKIISIILKIPQLFGLTRKMSSAMIASLVNTTTYSNVKILETGVVDFTPLEETIERVCTFYKKR